jgi:hypothetical protein
LISLRCLPPADNQAIGQSLRLTLQWSCEALPHFPLSVQLWHISCSSSPAAWSPARFAVWCCARLRWDGPVPSVTIFDNPAATPPRIGRCLQTFCLNRLTATGGGEAGAEGLSIQPFTLRPPPDAAA